MSGTLSRRLRRLERHSQPDPAPVRFVLVTRDDADGPDIDDEGLPAVRFTLTIDRATGGEDVADDA